jgi:hypothetical protein
MFPMLLTVQGDGDIGRSTGTTGLAIRGEIYEETVLFPVCSRGTDRSMGAPGMGYPK